VLPKVESVTLQEQIYTQLKEALILGQFVPGHVLTIRDLASAFGTSPMPVRGALFRLVSERALEMAGKKSMRVPQFSLEIFEEIANVRKVLEGYAVEIAAKNITDAQLEFVTNENNKLKRASKAKDLPTAVKCNRNFHFGIYESANSGTLVKSIEPLWLQHGAYMPLIMEEHNLAALDERDIVQSHDRLIDALRDGDRRRARKALEADIDETLKWYRQYRERGESRSTVGAT
jgi:DNA-binding GntR family transcriptional regulator